jgi:AAA domain
VFLRRIKIDGFLSFGQPAELNLGPGLTVVTGPNAAGKSNIGRCLDAARAVLAAHDDPEAERLDLYHDAGFEGAAEFMIKLDIELDQLWEQDLVRTYARASYVTSRSNPAPQVASSEESADWLEEGSLTPLFSGSLVIRYRKAATRPWTAAWQFTAEDKATIWHAVLVGDEGIHQLRPGTTEHPTQTGGGMMFADWLMKTKPQDKNVLDFRAAMRHVERPVTFSVNTGASQPGRISASTRELALQLGLNPDGRTFSFDQVMRLIVQRGIVLTDNRRLPLHRRFSVSGLGQPADLRDGAAVGAELFRLKNGTPGDRERFREIQATFRELTGRELEVRARPAPSDDGEPAMIIEPVVAGHHGERLVELSGAGIQEALVLSALLRNSPGRVTVLDEPAVNLEPTVQRRLTGRVRGPGQYLVITHNADLVPFDEQNDLERIVRVAPGPSGSEIRQPDYSDVRLKDQLRQLQLLEPTEVRSLLFASAVILCEGQTEVGALPRWWQKARGRAAGPGHRQYLLHQRLRPQRLRPLHQIPRRLRHTLGHRRGRARPAERPEALSRLA